MKTNTLTTQMNINDTVTFLSEYPDANVQTCAIVIAEALNRKTRILQLIQEALAQIRLDIKYIEFDSDCLRKERDEAYAKLSNGPFEEGK
jgi:hypothetical protein